MINTKKSLDQQSSRTTMLLHIGPYPGVALRKFLVALVAVNNTGSARLTMRSSRGGRPWTSSSPTWSEGLFLPIGHVLFLQQTTTGRRWWPGTNRFHGTVFLKWCTHRNLLLGSELTSSPISKKYFFLFTLSQCFPTFRLAETYRSEMQFAAPGGEPIANCFKVWWHFENVFLMIYWKTYQHFGTPQYCEWHSGALVVNHCPKI